MLQDEAPYTDDMRTLSRPEAIDSRLVFHLYAGITIPVGMLVYTWPAWTTAATAAAPWLEALRVVAAAVTATGCWAASVATIEDPVGRRRALIGFAGAHILLGAMLLAQSLTNLSPALPPAHAWTPLTVGLVLLYLAITGPGADFRKRPPFLEDIDPAPARESRAFVVRNKPAGIVHLRSQYEQQIRQAARQEERARLARDLHDAVKQQLFVIQTAAATAQARFETDANGAKTAVDQVRSAAREAMTEMEAMLEQLQAAPLENAGLVASIKKQCEALGFRTGAQVTFELGTLPVEDALDPGPRQAIFRIAQEALSNVARHARARNVRVSLGCIDGQLVLAVRDDGSGFNGEGGHRGMGMRNIATRAAEVGGNVEVIGAANQGTTVRFWVPCKHQPSGRPYLKRAILWTIVLIAAVSYLVQDGSTRAAWGAPAAALIAGIAVARYTVAAYRLRRSATA